MAGAHKITPSNPRLSSLLSDVAKGNIKIPVFQREYVWDDEQIMSLLDSIYRGFPVGSLLLWFHMLLAQFTQSPYVTRELQELVSRTSMLVAFF